MNKNNDDEELQAYMNDDQGLNELKETIKELLEPKNCGEILGKVDEIFDAGISGKKGIEALGQIEEALKSSGASGESIKEVVSELHFQYIQRDRLWKNEKSYAKLKKTNGAQYAIQLVKQIHEGIPLSIRGFKLEREEGVFSWYRESDRKTIRLNIPVSEETRGLKPASGDLAKQAIMAVFRFALHRQTESPGPIRFGDFLDKIGQKRTSEKQRERIRDYLTAFSYTHLFVNKKNEKGEIVWFEHAPFLKFFRWKGQLENDAQFYPTFNEKFGYLVNTHLIQYVYFDDKRLKPLSGVTGRDRKTQDYFKRMQGFKSYRIKVNNFLKEHGEFTEKKLWKMSLSQIKAFVNKNLELAKNETLKDYHLKNYRDKEKYLNQMITLFSKPIKKKSKLARSMTKQEHDLVERFAELAYDRADLYVETPEHLQREYLENYLKGNGEAAIPVVKRNLDLMEDELGENSNGPFYDGAEGPIARFWERLRKEKP